MDIKSTIQAKGFTLAYVADKLGVSKGSFSSQIKGNVTINTMRKIATIIGCSVTDFFADETAEVDAPDVDHINTPGSGGIVCPHCGRSIQLTAQ